MHATNTVERPNKGLLSRLHWLYNYSCIVLYLIQDIGPAVARSAGPLPPALLIRIHSYFEKLRNLQDVKKLLCLGAHAQARYTVVCLCVCVSVCVCVCVCVCV